MDASLLVVAEITTSYTWLLVEMALMLIFVAAIAYALMRLLGRPSLGGRNNPIQVVARTPLESRRSVYLLKIGSRMLLVGSAEGGLQTLAEISASDVPELMDSFNDPSSLHSSPLSDFTALLAERWRTRPRSGLRPPSENSAARGSAGDEGAGGDAS